MTHDSSHILDRIAQVLLERRGAVALTGAGISVDSGIPDFRSPGGLWQRFDPLEYATLEAFRRNPEKVWRMLRELDAVLGAAAPNEGHRGLARLESAGVLDGIITQNIDNLHQAGGSRRVVEFHGNGRRLVCLACGGEADPTALPRSGPAPRCGCGAVLKPDVVLFGEAIPNEAIRHATELAQTCRVMLVVGTSASVSPASMLPALAREHGALLVELNREPSEVSHLCHITCHGGASELLPALAQRVERLLAAG